MEHEVVVPLSAELVQHALQDPALLARCVPGLSVDADDTEGRPAGGRRGGKGGASGTAAAGPEEINGRLRVRIGGSTITYRGVISLIRSGGSGVLTAFVEGQEARGEGEVTATVRLKVAEDGAERAVLRFSGDLTPGGRLTEFDEEALALAGRRLLDRFVGALTAEAEPGERPAGLTVVADLTVETDDEAGTEAGTETEGGTEVEGAAADQQRAGDEEPLPDDLFADDLSDLIAFSAPEDFGLEAEPEQPAGAEPEPGERLDVPYGDPLSPEDVLAGPVRRSIVGRSAEEVDHAPPRGRYAPALPARSARARAASRWYGEQPAGAPVAARVGGRAAVPWVIGGGVALVGGAVVLARVLRRRTGAA
ncbi:carbon monoxide dehydrogenase [Kitasatospora sp. NPDC052896]|uniref:carbon monoxide dehydrogenase n=1 Tax=Kitasatospora sp. NPDC052896 TaxID=3364061 RepID=UPI0037C7B720